MIIILLTLKLFLNFGQEIDIIQANDSLAIKDYFNDSNLYLLIENEKTDTLLLINDFYINDLNSNVIIFPMSRYSVNILLFSQDKMIFEGDGFFDKQYENIPNFLIIPAKSKIILKIYLNNYRSYLLNRNNFIGAYFRFAKKSNLNNYFNDLNDSLQSIYNKSLTFNDTVAIQLLSVKSNLITPCYMEGNDSSYLLYNSIKKYFNIEH